MQAPFGAEQVAWVLAIYDCKDLSWALTREWALTQDTMVHSHISVDSTICGEISRVTFIGMSWLKHVAPFRGWWDFEVQRDF